MSIKQYAPTNGQEPEVSNQACALACPVSIFDLAGILGLDPSSLCGLAGRPDLQIKRVCIDSRAAGPDSLFVALRGARVDGHDYLEAVARAGVGTALVAQAFADSHKDLLKKLESEHGLVCLAVRDPLASLQDWAAAYLGTLSGLLRIGVSGSNGKTTTKEMLRQVLSIGKRVFASPGNLNSVIGLPLAALALDSRTDLAIFEMAMSEVGEMQRLARIVFPDLAVITNVGTAHIGNIGSREGIAAEKKQIFSGFAGTGLAFVPGDDDFADFLSHGIRGKVQRFGELDTAGYTGWSAWEGGQIIHWQGLDVHLRAAGKHIRSDALAVISMAVHLGIAPIDIQRGLESWTPAFGRNEILVGPVTVVQDCYNANPDSMSASLEAFMDLACDGGRRIAVLGDMRELGSHSPEAHRGLGQRVAGLDLDLVIFFGHEMAAAFQAWNETQATTGHMAAEHHADFESLVDSVRLKVMTGDRVLLKASRGMELERLTPILQGLAFADKGR